jgi:SAM-dependent methyltransferase
VDERRYAMSLYSKYVLPRLLHHGMASPYLTPYRAELLPHAHGRVLELGFGSGLNLPYYPSHLQELHAVEINAGMLTLAQPLLAQSPLPVHAHLLSAENLPFAGASFDTIVSTWTLCSIANLPRALAEVHRLLKPDGLFLFVEHGLSPEPPVQRWQHRLTPLQKVIADGCHLDRDIAALVAAAGFRFTDLRTEYVAGTPKIAGYFYVGMATR